MRKRRAIGAMKVTSASVCLISCLSLTPVLTADDLATVDLTNPQNIVLQWDAAALSAIRAVKPAPPVAARSLAILHTCMYDAWAPYDARALGTRFGRRIKLRKEHRQYRAKQEAISYASYRCLSDLFPTQVAAFRAMMTQLQYDPDNLTSDWASPVRDWRRHAGRNSTPGRLYTST